MTDTALAAELWIACARDLLFFVDTFGWTYNPRLKQNKVIPFVSYPFQADVLRKMEELLGVHDIGIEKTREMGASWMGMFLFAHSFVFKSDHTFLVVSSKEDSVDKTGDPDSLYWKLIFILEHLPPFLKPEYSRSHLHLLNLENNSTIDGAATTRDVGRGGRRTAIWLDEFAAVENGFAMLSATADATSCRIFNSTPKGVNNAHYAIMQMAGTHKIRMHWSQHPVKNIGLYQYQKDKIKFLDQSYKHPADYQFVRDGKLRSPWYDLECSRRPSRNEIAQELDCDYLGAGGSFFDSNILIEHERQYVRPPYIRGTLTYANECLRTPSFTRQANGPFMLWCGLDSTGNPQRDKKYVVACDVATGTGSSNSALTVGDAETGEKVLEWASPFMKAHEFAKLAMAVGYWFRSAEGPAFMIWEAPGSGRVFGDVVLESAYPNIYYQHNDSTLLVTGTTNVPGFHNVSKERKRSLLAEYETALSTGDFINHSEAAVKECYYYVNTSEGRVEHSMSIKNQDPTGANAQHGDRVIADALCCHVIKGMMKISKEKATQIVPDNSFMGRRIACQRAKEAAALFKW